MEQIELNSNIAGFNCTRCVDCLHSIVQASVKDYEEPNYIIPAERLTARQQHSRYWFVCLALNRNIELGQVSECEMHQGMPGSESSQLGGKQQEGTLPSIDFSKFMNPHRKME